LLYIAEQIPANTLVVGKFENCYLINYTLKVALREHFWVVNNLNNLHTFFFPLFQEVKT